MKTQLKLKPLSILSAASVSAFFAAAVLPLTSFSTWSEPLDCNVLTEAIEKKLIAKGVANYEFSIVEKDELSDGKKVVGTCAGGKMKVLYSKKKESMAPKVVVQESGAEPRKTVVKTADSSGGTHQFVGTKKDLAFDPWTRTKEVWGLTFSPVFEYEIRVRPEGAQVDVGTQVSTTITEIRYKN